MVTEVAVGVPMVTADMTGAVTSEEPAAVVKVLFEDTFSLLAASVERTRKLYAVLAARSNGSDTECDVVRA